MLFEPSPEVYASGMSDVTQHLNAMDQGDPHTAGRHWAYARAWLRRAVEGPQE
jgi:hypothetical protein